MQGISLIIPFYNRKETLPRTLQSIIDSTQLPDEIILVDNNSTDNYLVAIDKYIQQLSSLTTVKLLHCPKKGASAARNLGAENSSYDYLYFFDSDDELSNNFFKFAYREIRKCKYDLYVFQTRIILPNNKEYVRKHGFSRKPQYQILSSFLSTQSMLIRKDFLKKAQMWNEELFYWNDWELGVRLLLTKPQVRFIKGNIFHRIYAHADSITGNLYKDRYDRIVAALTSAYGNVINSSISYKKKPLKSLRYRKAIFAGMIRKEGDSKAAGQLLSMPFVDDSQNAVTTVEKLLFLYVANGGRGAWKIANLFV